MKKRLVQSMVMAMLVILSMASCTQQTGNLDGESDIPVVKWLVPGDKQPDITSVITEANNILEPVIGARLDLQFVDTAAYSEKMNMIMASSTPFDLCFTSNWINNYFNAVKVGGLMELDALIDKEAPELKNIIADYIWEGSKINGHIYSVANMQIMAKSNAWVVLKGLADKYDLNPEDIKTPDDLEPFLAKVKAGEPDIYPYRANYGTTPWLLSKYEYMEQGAINKTAVPIEAVMLDRTVEYQTAIQTMREWFEKGYVRSDILSAGDDTTYFENGRYAVSDTIYKPGCEAELEYIIGQPVIVIPYEKPYMSTISVTASLTGINKKSANPDKAIRLIEQVNTNKDLFNLLSFGIKDKHYTLNEDDILDYIDGSGYSPKAPWKFGNTFIGHVIKGQDKNIYEQVEAYNENAEKSPLLGFMLDTSNITSEISQVATVNAEYGTLSKGADDLKKYDEMIAKLDNAGASRILDEVNAQIQAFVESKN